MRPGKGAAGRAAEALRGPDFRKLLAIRLVSQSADGLFQASLITTVVFAPTEQRTAVGFAIATLIVSLPFSLLGPFTGVFIDRWSRRRIMLIAPLLRAAPAALVLFDPQTAPIPFYAGALWVLSVNRFFLATAQAVVPRLVPRQDLLVANSIATVGGTVSLLTGVFVGGLIADATGPALIVLAAAPMWVIAAVIATRISTDLVPHQLPEPADLLRHELRRVAWEFADGVRCLARTPRALAPITSITLDQFGQGVVLVLSLVVFRERFEEGVGSFSWLIGAGGAGVLLGLLSVGKLEERFAKERIIAGAFLFAGVVVLLVSLYITEASVLLASFAVGFAFACKKVPVDTMVQEALPDGLRGRVFAVYDVAYNLARVAAALLVVAMLPALGVGPSVALVGLVFIAWAPVLPRWAGSVPALVVRFYEGARAEEWPRAVVWGGVEENVEVLRSWREERDGERRTRFRLALEDGTVIVIAKADDASVWDLETELGSAPRAER